MRCLNPRNILSFLFLACIVIVSQRSLRADDASDSHYGPFGLYDHRSLYGKGVFPEPFLVDDSDREVNEFRLDWNHQGGKGQNDNVMRMELEKGFGLLTLELEVPYEYDTSTVFDPNFSSYNYTGTVLHNRSQGFDNINLGVRIPFYQYVSNDELIDSTFGVAIEVGVPSNSPLGKNAEIVPKVFNDTRIGEHFTAQTVLGWSFLRGSTDGGGGEQHLEYGIVFGWTLPHHELPFPGVQDFIPVLELQGETAMNTHQAGHDELIANFAFRANLYSIGQVQPRIGIGYLVPIDKGARDNFDWGIYTSLVFEF
jgi:hypothetical protein